MFNRCLILTIFMLIIISGCDNDAYRTLSKKEINELKEKVKALPDKPVTKDEKAVIVTNMGEIEIEFFSEVAPKHCANFKKLAKSGFYTGTTFHRVVPGFVIQGGDILTRDDDPNNDGEGNPGYNVDAEFSTISHERGIVSTARRPDDINSAGSQFFICVKDISHLDGQYTVFGKVIKGMEVVDAIVKVRRDKRDRPLENVVMEKVKIVKK